MEGSLEAMNTCGCSSPERKQLRMVMDMSINEALLTDYTQTLDVCRKRVDLYHVSLQFFLKLGFTKIAICLPDATLDGKLVVLSLIHI